MIFVRWWCARICADLTDSQHWPYWMKWEWSTWADTAVTINKWRTITCIYHRLYIVLCVDLVEHFLVDCTFLYNGLSMNRRLHTHGGNWSLEDLQLIVRQYVLRQASELWKHSAYQFKEVNSGAFWIMVAIQSIRSIRNNKGKSFQMSIQVRQTINAILPIVAQSYRKHSGFSSTVSGGRTVGEFIVRVHLSVDRIKTDVERSIQLR